MKFAHCRHCNSEDPVMPPPGHDIACQEEDCREGREPYGGVEPLRANHHCPFYHFHQSELTPAQRAAESYRIGTCDCGKQRVFRAAA